MTPAPAKYDDLGFTPSGGNPHADLGFVPSAPAEPKDLGEALQHQGFLDSAWTL